jgi:transposase-like protein
MARPKRQFPAKFKFQVVLEVLRGEKTAGQIAKAYKVHPNSLSNWKQQFMEHGPSIFSGQTAASDYERRIAELERLLGKKEVEIALLKNFLGSAS